MAGVEVAGINSVAVARYRDAVFNFWDKSDPKDATVILEMLKRHAVPRYVDPMVAGTHDPQELVKTHYQVSRARAPRLSTRRLIEGENHGAGVQSTHGSSCVGSLARWCPRSRKAVRTPSSTTGW